MMGSLVAAPVSSPAQPAASQWTGLFTTLLGPLPTVVREAKISVFSF